LKPLIFLKRPMMSLRMADVEAEVLRLRGIEVGITGIGRAVGFAGLPLALPLRFKLGKREGFALLLAGHMRSRKKERAAKVQSFKFRCWRT